MTPTPFDPFSDRLCRDIRNDLSTAFTRCIENSDDIGMAEKIAAQYLADQPPAPCREYIENRLASYRAALTEIASTGRDPIARAVILWNHQLHFEVHEVLEHAWLKAKGDAKLILQAMIRAAGAYVKIEAGYPDPANSLAIKALLVLREHRDELNDYFNPEVLIDGLESLNLPAPELCLEKP